MRRFPSTAAGEQRVLNVLERGFGCPIRTRGSSNMYKQLQSHL